MGALLPDSAPFRGSLGIRELAGVLSETPVICEAPPQPRSASLPWIQAPGGDIREVCLGPQPTDLRGRFLTRVNGPLLVQLPKGGGCVRRGSWSPSPFAMCTLEAPHSGVSVVLTSHDPELA